ncbi:nucleotidyltransferase domain-containing protein [Candidatus Woesearchaeota archaeon]|nr:nucleotidyltransferase domain-containing protein [Candidatus Woesearchaeota archaeon]
MDYSKIISKHKLSQKEQKAMLTKIDLTLKKINSEFTSEGIEAQAVLGGSAAKSTMLKGDFDVDVFARFDYSFKNKNISDILGNVLARHFQIDRVQGSRDYYQFTQAGLNYEIVPVLKIDNYRQALNVTDASPLHVDWVKKYTSRNPKLIDQILLTKIFLKANSLYGAESYIRGFSGHVVDILTIHYSSFEKLLQAASRWQYGELIDPEKHYTGSLNKSKKGALIIIDPVQPERNAAAALSTANFNRFRELAELYMQKPSEKYFVKQKFSVSKLKSNAKPNKLILLEVKPSEGKKDVVGAKLLKAFMYIRIQLKHYDFKLIDAGWNWDNKQKAIFWYIVDKTPLSKTRKHQGPPLKAKQHVKAFKAQHKNTFIENNKIHATLKREYTKPEQLIKFLIKEDYLKQRIKSINPTYF